MRIITIILFYLCYCFLHAQEIESKNGKPLEGKPIPEFILNDVHYYNKKTIRSDDFKGKWLVLDFWTRTCTSCIKSFPKINTLQKHFKDKVQFILVGLKDNKPWNKNIPLVYEKFRKKYDLDLVVAYDSILFKEWDILSVPKIFIIDPFGTVRAITNGVGMDIEKIQKLLDGENPSFFPAGQKAFDANKLLLIDGNGGTDRGFLYRSILVDFKPGDRMWAPGEIKPMFHHNGDAMFQVTGVPVSWLYQYAYLGSIGSNKWSRAADPLHGKVYPKPILQLKDTSLFNVDHESMKGIYSYSYSASLSSQKITKEHIMAVMQNDLKNYFGFEAKIEVREMPCMELVATLDAKRNLVSEGKLTQRLYEPFGISYRNQPIGELLNIIGDSHPYPFFPIINKTGINGNIDIDIEAELGDFEELKKVLNKKGLSLINGKQKMYVLVIKDVEKNIQPFLERFNNQE